MKLAKFFEAKGNKDILIFHFTPFKEVFISDVTLMNCFPLCNSK